MEEEKANNGLQKDNIWTAYSSAEQYFITEQSDLNLHI